MKRAFVYVPRDCIFNKQDVTNAINLCRVITETPTILIDTPFEQQQESLKLFEGFTVISPETMSSKATSVINSLDGILLNEEILIVAIGTTDQVNNYLHLRSKDESVSNVRWNIVGSDYARFAFLAKQHSISDLIPSDTELWIRKLIRKYGKSDILSCLDNLQNTKTVLLGESIIDEYIYCDALGKVSKDPILAFQTKESFRHTGGVLAAAKHFAGLGSQSLIFSEIGPKEEVFVNKELESYYNLKFDLHSEFGSIIKTRFVDRASGSRVFETYNLPQNYNNDGFFRKILRFLNSPNLENYNFIVMDYGHGLISDELVKVLLDSKLHLSVNTQSNAGNRGFNSIARYAGAKKAFLNGSEVQLEARNKHAELSVVVVDLARRLEFSEIYVTNGAAGIIAFSHEMGSFSMPAFAATIVDRVGAGDATLAVISALRSASVPIEISLFYGNIAGALLVSSIGNEFSISKEYLLGKAEEILRKVR